MTTPEQKSIINNLITPKNIIVAHIPTQSIKRVEEFILKEYNNAIIFKKGMIIDLLKN